MESGHHAKQAVEGPQRRDDELTASTTATTITATKFTWPWIFESLNCPNFKSFEALSFIMRFLQHLRPSPLAALTSVLLLRSVSAHPYPKDDVHDKGVGYLMDRDCVQYCGYNNMYCCGSGQECYTSNGIAGCSNAAAGGGYALYTTTWTLTETFTSTKSSYFPAATTPAPAACVPEPGTGQIACGSICCANWQYCAYENQCMANAGGGGGDAGTTWTTVITTGGTTITTQYSAPYRVTSGATVTATTTGTGVLASATTTGNGTAVSSGGTGSNLSGGAIAGIVIGVIAGVILLLLLCFCCIVRGLWHGLLAIFGLGKKKDRRSRETVIEEERYTRHGSVHSRRDRHTGWFGGGGRPSTVAGSRRTEKKKSSGAGWLGLGAAAGTLLLLLGLRRDKKRRATKTRSDVSSSYFSDSYTASSPSSASSGGRTRDTRRSRRTERSRVSRAPSRR